MNVKMRFDQRQSFNISEEVLFQEVSGEMVLLDLASEQYFGLDAVGARIWSLLESGANAGSVLDTLLQEFEVDRVTLETDTEELLGNLIEAGLITVREIG